MSDKILNCMCFCGVGLLYIKNEEVIMLNPCEHLVHKHCFIDNNCKCCPYCNTKVTSITRGGDFMKDPSLYQKCVDILSVTNFDDAMDISYDDALLKIPRLVFTAVRVPFTKGFENGRALCGDLLRLSNIKIKVKGLDKIKDEPKIFVANHTCYLDVLVMFYVLKAGFVASATIKNNTMMRPLLDVIPILTVELNKKGGSSTVKRMKEYVNNMGPLCVFPEGMLSHPSTLMKFRTGAFNVGCAIYPVVLKYKNLLADTSISDFILKLGSSKSETVEMMILDPFYPPFNDDKIEFVRKTMADKGELLLARTSNKDIDSSKTKGKIGR